MVTFEKEAKRSVLFGSNQRVDRLCVCSYGINRKKIVG